MDENLSDILTLNVDLPDSARAFPTSVEFIAALRHACRHYKRDGGRILVKDDSPETDANERGSGTMYTMCIQVPLIGHGAVVNDELCVCEAVYATLGPYEMANAAATAGVSSLKWLVGDNPSTVTMTSSMSQLMSKAAFCYRSRGPLMAYSNLAVLEAENHSSDSPFWRQLYKPMETCTCHYGWEGVVFDCTVLSMGDSVGDDDSPNLKNREPKPEHDGFIDPCYTPHTKAAGRVRALVCGVVQRIETSRTYELVHEILNVLQCRTTMGGGDWIVRWKGFVCTTTLEVVTAMVNMWKNMCEDNMPVLHVFESARVLTISSSSGVLIRPIRVIPRGHVFEFEGPYVDSMAVHHSDTLRFIGKVFPSTKYEPEQHSCFLLLTKPFHKYSTEPRENLSIQMGLQALNLSPVKGDATITSLGMSKPLIVTSYMDTLMRNETDECRVGVAGKNTVIAFINRRCNTEDAVSVLREWAESGAFAWQGYISYQLPKRCGLIRPGTKLDKQDWWVPAIPGIVMKVTTSKSGDQIAIVYINSRVLRVGDKLMLGHGVKFTVGELIPLKDMPSIKNSRSGEEVIPNVLVNTKNLTRGIGGLVREMAACTNRFESMASFRSLDKPKGKYVYTPGDERGVEPTIPEGSVMMYGEVLRLPGEGENGRVVRCNYGIARLCQLRHLPVFKQHYPSGPVFSIKIPRGRMKNGTPRLGETELLSMLMQGLNLNPSEAVRTSDNTEIAQCSRCGALPPFCDCPRPKPPLRVVETRYSLTELDVFATIAMLNTPDKPAFTLRFLTST